MQTCSKPKNLVIILVLLVLFFYPLCSLGKDTESQKTSAAFTRRLDSSVVLDDLKYLYKQLKKVHPDLFFSRNRTIADREYKQLREVIKEESSLTVREIYLKLAPFVAGFKDSHTSLTFYNEFNDYCKRGGKIIPIYAYFREGSILITETVNESGIPAGSLLLSINGIPSQAVISDALNLISYERQSYGLGWASKLFPIWTLALYGPANTYQIAYETPDGTRMTANLLGVSLEDYNEGKGELYPRYASDWNLKYVDENIALLTINTFSGSKRKEFGDFLKSAFREIKTNSTESLIVDIRDNGGGSTKLSDTLYSYLSEKPFRTFAEVMVRYSDPVLRNSPSLNPFSRIWQFLRTRASGNETVVYENDLVKPPDREFRFSGDLYVLIGRRTFSTAADFASLIKDFSVGTLVGEETGGLASCFGDAYLTELPGSGLSLRISYKYFLRPGGFDDGRGVLPDVTVKDSPVSQALGEDQALQTAIKLAKSVIATV